MNLIGAVTLIIRLTVVVVIWLAKAWVFLCVKVPLRVWAWVWTRPWRQRTRLSVMLVPWALVGLLVILPGEIVENVGRERTAQGFTLRKTAFAVANSIVRKEDEAFASALRSMKRFVRPERSGRHSALDLLARSWLVVLGPPMLLPCLISIVLGGPFWVFVLRVCGLKRQAGVVNGREWRTPRYRAFRRWRSRADKQRTWFVGSSATGLGALAVSASTRLTHTWVVGATGTGKTQSVLLPMLRSDILAGRPVVFVDGKGDRETVSALWHLARAAGREKDFRFFDLRRPGVSSTYSPFLSGTANEQADKIMAALRWDNEYYRSQSHAVLLRVLRALQASGVPYSLDDLAAAVSNLAAFRALAALVPVPQRDAELEPIAARWRDYQVETAGMRAQLDTLLMTDFGELLTDAQPNLDLAAAYRDRSIVYFALPVARFPQTAPLVAKLIIGDLNSVAGMVQDGTLAKTITSVVIDEFAAFAMPLFIDLLNKARSAGMAITISHQSMRGDLAAAGEGYVGQVADNTNVKICLRQAEDAEYVASLAGTRPIIKRTEQTQAGLLGEERTGLGSAREADEFQVSPNVVREMPQGFAVVKIDQPVRTLDIVALDYLDPSDLLPYEPLPREHVPMPGLALRQMGSRDGSQRTPSRQRVREPTFDGA